MPSNSNWQVIHAFQVQLQWLYDMLGSSIPMQSDKFFLVATHCLKSLMIAVQTLHSIDCGRNTRP